MKKVLFVACLLVGSAHSAQDTNGILQEGPGALPEGANALPEEPNVLPEEPEPGALPGDPSVLKRILMGAKATGIGKIVCNSALTSLPFAVVAYAVRYIPSTPNWLRTSTFVAFVGGASAAVALSYQCLRNRVYVIHRTKDLGTRRNVIIGREITSLNNFSGATAEAPNTTLQNVLFEAGFSGDIGGNAFSDCTALQSIVIPDGIQSIGANAFRECRSLKSIDLPESLENIGPFGFTGCSSLREVTFRSNTINIGGYAFWGARNLKKMTFTNNYVTISAERITGHNSVEEFVFERYNPENKPCLLGVFFKAMLVKDEFWATFQDERTFYRYNRPPELF
jgi:hypothetical protein